MAIIYFYNNNNYEGDLPIHVVNGNVVDASQNSYHGNFQFYNIFGNHVKCISNNWVGVSNRYTIYTKSHSDTLADFKINKYSRVYMSQNSLLDKYIKTYQRETVLDLYQMRCL